MMKTFTLLFILIAFLPFNNQSQNIYQKHFGLAMGDEFIRQVKPTSDKGFAAIGYTTSTGKGKKDLFLSKFDYKGELQWTKTYGGDGDDDGFSLEQTSDGGYILIGSTTSLGSGDNDIYVIKTNDAGVVTWSKAYGGAKSDIGRDITSLPSGGYLVLSQIESNSFGLIDVCLMRITATGTISWVKAIGGVQNDLCYNLRKSIDNEYFLYGITFSYGEGKHDFLLIKVSESGSISMCKTFGTSNEDYAYAVNQTLNGDVYLAGYSYSNSKDNILMKTDNSLNILWQKDFSSTKDEYVCDILPTAEDGIFVNGITYSYGAGDMDIFQSNFNTDGQMSFFKTYGGVNKDQVANKSSFIDLYNKVVIGAATFSFNSSTMRSTEIDAYLIKTDFAGKSGCNEATYSPTVKNSNLKATDIVTQIGIKSISLNTVNAGTDAVADFLLTTMCFEGISELNNIYEIKYHNPIENAIVVNFNLPVHIPFKILLCDMLGKVVFDDEISEGFFGDYSISTESLKSGVYIFSMICGEYLQSIKMIKN